jgi:hypothetical protein
MGTERKLRRPDLIPFAERGNRMTKTILPLPALLVLAALMPATLTPAAAQAQTAAETDAARAQVWALEQSIYAGRAKGNLSAYNDNLAKGYLAWPPVSDKPLGPTVLHNAASKLHASQEKLDMQFVDFSMNGNTAVIYYTTHRTRLADGTAVDNRFETTHTWIREDGKWHVFAGMARLVAAKKP